jgi:hypothetical protein
VKKISAAFGVEWSGTESDMVKVLYKHLEGIVAAGGDLVKEDAIVDKEWVKYYPKEN